MKKQPLSIKQREFLDFIKSNIEENGYSPSWSALGKHFKTSIPNVRRYIVALIAKGHISRDNSTRPPSITVL